jgi:hypothetical protein
MLFGLIQSFIRTSTLAVHISKRSYIRVPSNIRDKIDFSRVPRLNPKDVVERVSRGSGPGGQVIIVNFMTEKSRIIESL